MAAALVTFLAAGSAFGSGKVSTTGKTSQHGGKGHATNLKPLVSLSPSSVTFPTEVVGITSPPQTVGLTNTGNANLSLTSIAISGADAGDFAETNNCGLTLVANGSCAVSVIFTPTTTGQRTASVVFTDNASGNPQLVPLTGSTADAIANLSPSSFNFGSVNLGSPSQQTSVLTNTGTATLTMTSFALSGTNAADFSVSNDCGASVLAGGQCFVVVTFTPSNIGTRTASVVITDSASDSPQSIALTGNGNDINFAVTFTPASLAFGNQQQSTSSGARIVTMTNAGAATSMTISSIAVSTGYSNTTTCGSTLAPEASCTISVTFTPTIVGAQNGTLTVTDTGPGSPQTVALTGTGTSASTTLFSNNFASGDFSGWGYIFPSPDVSINSNPTYIHSGSYSASFHYHHCGIPVKPTLSSSVSGALPETTYYVVITGVSATGETTASVEQSLLVAANSVLTVTLPAAQPDLTGINVYVGASAGTETLQNASPLTQATTWTEPNGGLTAGVTPPATMASTVCGTSTQDSNRWLGQAFTSSNAIYALGYLYIKTPEPDAYTNLLMGRKLLWFSDSADPGHQNGNYALIFGTYNASKSIITSTNNLGLGLQYDPAGPCPASQGIIWDMYNGFNYDTWYGLEVFIGLNTPGVANGIITVWVNGTQVYSNSSVLLRPTGCTQGIHMFSVGDQANRANFGAMDEYRYWNQLTISTGYIVP